jgi:hypothetical protein
LTALEAGYNMRAVIRKPEQAQEIKTHVKIAPHADRLEFAVVPVLTDDGAFDNILADVVAILHIASPLALRVCLDLRQHLLVYHDEAYINRLMTTNATSSIPPFE